MAERVRVAGAVVLTGPPRARLSPADVALLGGATIALPVARLLLTCAPAWTVRRFTTRARAYPPGGATRPAALAIARVAARAPVRFTCLEQAVALVAILAVLRRPGRVILGVGHEGRGIRAHAWVDCDGQIVLGGDPHTSGLHALDAQGRPRPLPR